LLRALAKKFMKHNLKIQSRKPVPAGGKTPPKAFTLTGLVVVIAVSALLAAMLLLMLAQSRQVSQTSVCANNLKQLGLGINIYADDHNQLYPPGCLESEDTSVYGGGPDSWDSMINHYIGGNLTTNQLTDGSQLEDQAPKVIACPADTAPFPPPNEDWTGGLGDGPTGYARRSYCMNDSSAGAGDGGLLCTPPNYPTLPTPTDGIGIYWEYGSGILDLNPPGYPTRIIQDAAGTILLCEHPYGDNAAGNAWESTCIGPTNNSPQGSTDIYSWQLDPGDVWSHGVATYQAHGNKFNYLFHDNHVSGLAWQQTLGTGTTKQALAGIMKGMWTIKAGD
jgi:prepilin-type processing-associated H-X9-DG protein